MSNHDNLLRSLNETQERFNVYCRNGEQSKISATCHGCAFEHISNCQVFEETISLMRRLLEEESPKE